MEIGELEPLIATSERLLMEVSFDFKRYLYEQVDWQDRLICIKGPKGVGKTTMILQHTRESYGLDSGKAIYLAMDHLWFASHDILKAVDCLYSNGYRYFVLDEVHHFANWPRLVKTLADSYPDIKIVYSGSSVLKLTKAKADLSRRQLVYSLKGLSFREFLKLEGALDHPPVGLKDLLVSHVRMAREIAERITVLPLFRRYLANGYYPIYRTAGTHFAERLAAAVSTVIETDVPVVTDVTPATVRKIKRMLMILAESCPQTPNMSALYRELETDRNAGIRMFETLASAELVTTVTGTMSVPKLKRMGVAEKVFLGDPNLMHALSAKPEVGAVRETFFANQLAAAGHSLVTPQCGDFVVNGELLFEIGGEGKGFGQIKDIKNSYVVADGIERGRGNKIPLWLFGFLY